MNKILTYAGFHSLQGIADFSGLQPKRVFDLFIMMGVDINSRDDIHHPPFDDLLKNKYPGWKIKTDTTRVEITKFKDEVRYENTPQYEGDSVFSYTKDGIPQYLYFIEEWRRSHSYSDLAVDLFVGGTDYPHLKITVPITEIFSNKKAYENSFSAKTVLPKDAFLLTLGLSPDLPDAFFDSLLAASQFMRQRRSNFRDDMEALPLREWLEICQSNPNFNQDIPSFLNDMSNSVRIQDTKQKTTQTATKTKQIHTHALHELIKKNITTYKRNNQGTYPSAREIWECLREERKNNPDSIIQEITYWTAGHVYINWISPDGHESNLKRKSFQNLISRFKKNPG